MTTEERFIRIENALQTVSENQVRHEGAIRDLIVVSRTLLESQKQTTAQIQQLYEGQQQNYEAQQQNQQDLSEIQREVAEMDRKFEKKMDALSEKQANTEEKLNALIEIVDRIIRRENGKS